MISLDEFLARGGTSRSQLVAELAAKLDFQKGDVLLAVGSLVEGLANRTSDLDLLWLTSRRAESLPARNELALVVGRCVVDVEILGFERFQAISPRLSDWARTRWAVVQASDFSFDERRLLHRLAHAEVLHGIREHRRLKRPSRQHVARLKLHVARQISRTIQIDMVGYRDIADYRSLVFVGQELLGHAVDALLAGYLLTNPMPKWRSRLLDSLPKAWEDELGSRPSGLRPAELVWELHRAPKRAVKGASLEHAFRISNFARAVFLWAEGRLTTRARTRLEASASRAMPLPRGTILPRLDLNVDFALKGNRALLGRLNELGETLEVSSKELALALLCDGRTTTREAESRVCAGSSADGRPLVEAFVARLKQAKLDVA